MLHCLKRKFVFLFQFIVYLLREIAFLFRVFCKMFQCVFIGVSVEVVRILPSKAVARQLGGAACGA